jgi:CRP-like cAMP-binding protein
MLSKDDRAGNSAVAPRPLTELLACPGSLEQRLGASSERRDYKAGDLIFSQGDRCEGLFLLLAGEFCRSSYRRDKRVNLGILHPGDLVELAAVLGDGGYNFSLQATTDAAALLFPMSVLRAAFQEYSPLRMHLLEELGREVSRAYGSVYVQRKTRNRHPGTEEQGS